MDRANLTVAVLSALVGAISLGISLGDGRLISLGSVLGSVLLANAVVRYRLAGQH